MAKFLIVYSSHTGNTKKVAEALYEEAPDGSFLAKAEDMPSASGFDAVFAGYWIDRGGPDSQAAAFLKTIHHQKVVLFETLGADPASEHAVNGLANGAVCLSEDNRVVGTFSVQGAIDPNLIEKMKSMGANNPHNAQRMADSIQKAAFHPNEQDLNKAREYMRNFKHFFDTYFQAK